MSIQEIFKIIHKYIPPESPTYPIYITHCHMVAAKAQRIARRLQLESASIDFVREAALLHDIGIIATDSPSLFCTGTLPYLCHGTEGRAILESEGFPAHGLVAERHIGVGMTAADIEHGNLPLPYRDMTPQRVEEEIVGYADLFFSKRVDRLWLEKPLQKVRKSVAKHGPAKLEILADWIVRFEE